MERYHFTIADGDYFEHVGEAVYASSLAAESACDTDRQGTVGRPHLARRWISVHDSRGNEFARVSIGIERTLTKSEAARRNSQQAIRKSNALIQRLDGAAARRARRPPGCDDRDD